MSCHWPSAVGGGAPGWSRTAVLGGAGGMRPPAPGGGALHYACLGAARLRTRRHHPRAVGPGARTPTWSGRGSPPPVGPGTRRVGDITYIRTWEGLDLPGDCCRAAAPRKVVGCATGVTARGTDLRRARRSIWRPAGARTRQGETVLHSIPLGPGVPVHL